MGAALMQRIWLYSGAQVEERWYCAVARKWWGGILKRRDGARRRRGIWRVSDKRVRMQMVVMVRKRR